MLAAAVLATFAIVTQDVSALRNAPRDSAAQQAVLYQGDMLEIRGRRLDYLQVYDHRRERAGYLHATQVRTLSLQENEAPELLGIVRFLRDTSGAEALGIAYVAAYLKAAPANAIGAEPFDALATMAERLARRASLPQGGERVAAHLEVANAYGVQFKSYEQNGAVRLCYEGDAFRRIFALSPTPDQRARAALALTRDDCTDPALRPSERAAFDRWRGEVLDRVDADAMAQLPAVWKNRLQLRRAGVWSTIAFERAREHGDVAAAAQRALDALASVDKTEMSEADEVDYNDAAMRVGASRWGAEAVPVATSTATSASSRPSLVTEPGQAGETCVLLTDAAHGPKTPLARRCTYGVVWTASASVSPNGRAVVLAVQPLAGWRELWAFERRDDAWIAEVLPPAAADPELGYVEFAGWVPGGNKLLLAREARVNGRFKRSFEVATLGPLMVEQQASAPTLLALFSKWQDPAWKRSTVSVR